MLYLVPYCVPKMAAKMLRAAIVAAAAVASVDGHASMTRPVPRNAADANLTIFKDGSWPTSAGKAGRSGCSCTGEAGGCDAGLHRPQTNGQPCLWFNQGCSPGCKTCTGTNGHANKPLCDTFMEPTNTDPRTRTEHPTDAKSYHYTPWRSPGHAPVTDAWYGARAPLAARAPTPRKLTDRVSSQRHRRRHAAPARGPGRRRLHGHRLREAGLARLAGAQEGPRDGDLEGR